MAVQMLLVEQRITSEEVVTNHKSINIDDFIWPHGITPPLHQVRKRRFRRRVNRRTIESVEQEVERLLEQDALADDVKYGEFSSIYIVLSQYLLHRGLGQRKPGLVGLRVY